MNPFKAFFLIGSVSITLFAAKQLQIEADRFEGNEKSGRSVFEGHVKIRMGRDELNASRVEVYTDAERRPVKYVADGHASFFLKTDDNATYRGRAEKVVFRPLEQEYRFFGDVHLMQVNEHKQIDGEEVVVNIKKGTAKAKGARDQPVIMIFDLPEKERK